VEEAREDADAEESSDNGGDRGRRAPADFGAIVKMGDEKKWGK
jgi:hypothetical protein